MNVRHAQTTLWILGVHKLSSETIKVDLLAAKAGRVKQWRLSVGESQNPASAHPSLFPNCCDHSASLYFVQALRVPATIQLQSWSGRMSQPSPQVVRAAEVLALVDPVLGYFTHDVDEMPLVAAKRVVCLTLVIQSNDYGSLAYKVLCKPWSGG